MLRITYSGISGINDLYIFIFFKEENKLNDRKQTKYITYFLLSVKRIYPQEDINKRKNKHHRRLYPNFGKPLTCRELIQQVATSYCPTSTN